MNRRSFMTLCAAASLRRSLAASKIPVGLEMYSVRDEFTRDPTETIRAVADMGYQGVEFYAPYFDWTLEHARTVRSLLDSLKIRCFSTHNGPKSFSPEGLIHAAELNQALGSRYVVLASAGNIKTLDGWKPVAAMLTQASAALKQYSLSTGYHNHKLEFLPVEGKRPIEYLAENTPKDVMLQLDVGTCIEAGSDPVAWIRQNPGRIKSLHVKEWSKADGYQALLGEGEAPWPKILQAAENTGGVEYYLIEQEGSRYPPLETAKKCLVTFQALRTP
ncbi:MAG: sugar phosphate isomerase/epimerase [Acidobacteriota bacterium]|nr:sugar phosphate isomerase/epimerase [Acidobacteriota bacterium]